MMLIPLQLMVTLQVLLHSIPNSDIVDWVLVELRTGTASGTKVGDTCSIY